VRLKTYLNQHNLQPQNVGLAQALRVRLDTGGGPGGTSATVTAAAGKVQNRQAMCAYIQPLAIAYDAFITGVIKSARTGGDGVCAPAHTATTETDRTSRDCNKAAWYLNTQMPQLPTTGAVGLDAAAMGIRLGRGEKMYLVQFPASTAPDGSNMFIPSNGIGLELERVPVTDGSAECIFRVLKNAEDHLPKHVLDGLTFFGLDGSRGYERKVLKGDRLLAVNSRIVCNTTRLYHDGVFCSESFPRTYLMVRDVKIQRVRAVTQISGGVRKTTRADESKKMVIRSDETKRRRRTSSKKADEGRKSTAKTRKRERGEERGKERDKKKHKVKGK
jgi:hypothetical protein